MPDDPNSSKPVQRDTPWFLRLARTSTMAALAWIEILQRARRQCEQFGDVSKRRIAAPERHDAHAEGLAQTRRRLRDVAEADEAHRLKCGVLRRARSHLEGSNSISLKQHM